MKKIFSFSTLTTQDQLSIFTSFLKKTFLSGYNDRTALKYTNFAYLKR